ncbi:MAG: HD domain-containing protein [Candidatus Eisenbacteria sp.]|nr:HD domain-containing protein [Candidatus Eisenbacteria bacterium]
MRNPEAFPPPGDVIDSGFADMLRSTAALTNTLIQIWSPDGNLVFSAPHPAPAALTQRASLLAHRSIEASHPFREIQSNERPLLAVPVRSAGKIAALITAIPWAAPWSTNPVGDPLDRAAALSSILPAQAGKGTSPPVDYRQDWQAMIETLAWNLGRHLELLECSADQRKEIVSLHGELDLLRRISAHLASSDDTYQPIEFVLQQGCAAVGADLAVLQLPETRVPISCPNPLRPAPRIRISGRSLRQLAGQLWWRVGTSNITCLHGRLNDILGSNCPLPDPVCIALNRLSPKSPKAGFLAYLRAGHQPFDQHQLRLLDSLAEQSSLALRSAALCENVNDFLMSTVKALVSAMEAKDPCTSGHSARVNLISMLLGKHLELPSSEMETLKWASILHDVGKIGMPESILKKPGQLNPDEFDVVKQHPWRGYKVINHVSQLKVASQAVLFHHERVDGRGYPTGISGNAIPHCARIISVADTFDALTSTRPYREARTEDEAYEEIRRVRGSQLDRDVVDALADMLPFLKEHRVMLESAQQTA